MKKRFHSILLALLMVLNIFVPSVMAGGENLEESRLEELELQDEFKDFESESIQENQLDNLLDIDSGNLEDSEVTEDVKSEEDDIDVNSGQLDYNESNASESLEFKELTERKEEDEDYNVEDVEKLAKVESLEEIQEVVDERFEGMLDDKLHLKTNTSLGIETLSNPIKKDVTFNVLYEDHPEVQGYNFRMNIYIFNLDNPYYEPTYPESAWEYYDYIDFYNLDNDNSVLYEGFPYLDGEGKLLQYKFEINNHYNGDNYKYNIVVEGNVDDGFNIWVKLKSPEDLTVTKQWIGGPKEKPKVYFQLYRSYSYSYNAARNNSNDQINGTLNPINNNDRLSSYRDFSDTTLGWIWSNPSNGGWEEETIDLGSYYYTFEKVGDIVELNNETLQATFENMPQYIDYDLWGQKGSAKIYYYVREVDENGNDYEHEDYISGPVLPDENEGYFTAQNIYNKLEIPVKKIWKGTEKDEVEVILLKDGKEIERLILNKDSNWEGTFELPKYEEFCNIQQILPPPPLDYEGDWNYDWHFVIEDGDPLLPCDDLRILDLLEEIRNGDFPYHTRFVKELREIEYTNLTIKEVEVDGYTSIISGDYKEGFEIVNSKIIPKTEITFYKQWINGPEVKPTIEVQLYRDGEAYGDPVTLADGELSYTWTNLDKTDEFDNAYVYTVDEVNVPEGYEKDVDGLTITNTFIIEKIEVTVDKVWVGGPDKKPTIEVQLYRDGEAYGDPVTLVDGELSYTWTDLDKTDSKGTIYVYTVDEVSVPEGYEVAITGSMGEGFVVTNTEKTEEPTCPTCPEPETPDKPECPTCPQPDTPDKPGKPSGNNKSPQTGDAGIGFTASTMLFSAAAFVASKKKRK